MDGTSFLSDVKPAALPDQHAQIRTSIEAWVEIRMCALDALPDAGKVLAAIVVQFASRARDQLPGFARHVLFLRPGIGRSCDALLFLRLSFEEVLDIVKPVADIAESYRGLLLGESIPPPLLMQTLRQPSEFAVRRDQSKSVERTLVHHVHGSITRAMSEAFLPFVLLRCWCCGIASDWIALSQLARCLHQKSL